MIRTRQVPVTLFWICVTMWLLSFFLPAAQYEDWGRVKTMFGWDAAVEALIFFFMPVKGAWFGFFPQIWSVFANFFVPLAGFVLLRRSEANHPHFAVVFTAAAAIPVGLLFIPLVGIRTLEVGFSLWSLSIIGASACFAWTARGKWRAMLPHVVLSAVLLGGLFVWSPYLQAERRRVREEQEAAEKQGRQYVEMLRQRDASDAAARNALAQQGLVAFHDPLTETQYYDLNQAILRARPDELIAVSQHYQDIRIMLQVARRTDCPVEALRILYRRAMEKEKVNPEAADLYPMIARNPNVPRDLLLSMFRSDSPAQRAAALRSGMLPEKQKMAYLTKACTFTDENELNAAAEDADTPVEILKCLSSKPGAGSGVAYNPHTPTAVLEQMSQSSDWRIANDAKLALKERNRQSR